MKTIVITMMIIVVAMMMTIIATATLMWRAIVVAAETDTCGDDVEVMMAPMPTTQSYGSYSAMIVKRTITVFNNNRIQE